VVLDASTAIGLCFPDESSDCAEAVHFLGQSIYDRDNGWRMFAFRHLQLCRYCTRWKAVRVRRWVSLENDGAVGIALLLGGDTMPNRTVVQISGGAFRMHAKGLLCSTRNLPCLCCLNQFPAPPDLIFGIRANKPSRASLTGLALIRIKTMPWALYRRVGDGANVNTVYGGSNASDLDWNLHVILR
jgi:hypothetical protein